MSIDINQVKVEYPVLRKAVYSNLTVLFTDEHTGVVLVANNLWFLGSIMMTLYTPKIAIGLKQRVLSVDKYEYNTWRGAPLWWWGVYHRFKELHLSM